MLPQKALSQLLLGLILLYGGVGSAQSIFEQFGIKHYGNSHDQPFYHAEDIQQDSLNRLIFKYSSKFLHYDRVMEYDGIEFRKTKTLGRGKFLFRDTINDVIWYKPDLFTAIAYRDDSIFAEIHTDDYFKLNFHRIYMKDNILFALTNSGILEYQWIGKELIYIRSISFSSDQGVVDNLEIVGDTLFCNTSEGVMYKLYDEIDIQHKVEVDNLDIKFQLPGGRLIRYDRSESRIVEKDSWIGSLLHYLGNTTTIYLEDSHNRFWAYITSGTNKGINVYEQNSMIGQKVDLGIPNSTQIEDIYEDHEGNIWIGTNGEGLIQIYEKTIQVLDRRTGLTRDNVSSIMQGKDGSIYLSQGCNGVSIVRSDFSIDGVLDKGCAKSVVAQNNGMLWLNTYGLLQFQDEEYQKHYLRKDGLHSRTIKSIFEDSQGVLWVGTRQAIHRFDGSKFIPYVDENIGFFNRVFNIVELAQDSFLLAFTDGQIMSFYNGVYTDVESSTAMVSHLYQDSEERVWVATEGEGLHRYKDNRVEPLLNRSLLSSDISFLQEDAQGDIWSISEDNTVRSANKGALWNNKDIQVQKYTVADGLPLIHNDRRMQPAAELLDNGKIIFPNIHGAIVLDPNKIKRVKPIYKSIINYNDSIYTTDNIIRLPVGMNDIFFGYTNITLHPENHFEYQYSFSQSNWKTIDDPSAINITNVPYRSNTLTIRSRYADEEWFESSIEIVAPPPYYYRWWFALLTLIGLSGIVTLLVKWRTGIVKTQNKLLEEKVSQQTEELQNEKEQLAESLNSQQQLTHELNLSQASKNRMYAQISHEFKSPLQAINSYLNSTTEHISVEDKNRISGNIKQLLHTSSEIMELSKAESGTLRAKKDHYNINNIIQEQIELKQALSREKDITISFLNVHERVYILCDISLMQKVIGNLLSNAIKFSERGSVIDISSTPSPNNHQYIAVKDSGVGIPNDEIANLTLAYFQASNNNEEGTGIGLSLVDRILRLHDSHLDVESSLGNGSIFSFLMARPMMADKEIEALMPDIADIPAQVSQIIDPEKKTVLAVDDSIDILHFVKRALNKNYNVITTTNGLSALEHISIINPDLVLSDVNMPIIGGNELLKRVRLIEEYQSIPFLLLTGSISDDTELAGLKSGADFVLQKPIDVDLLESQISQVLKRQVKVLDRAKEKFVHGLLPQHMLDDDKQVMIVVETYILDNLDNTKLLSGDIANAIGVGEKTLRNKVKSITGFTIKEYLKNFRLEKAKLLLAQDYGTKGEVAAAVGFSSLSYFSKSYKKYFSGK